MQSKSLIKSNIGIFGAGAIGSLLAAYVEKNKLPVRLFGKISYEAKNPESSKTLISKKHTILGEYNTTITVHETPPEPNSIDVAILAVKAYDVFTTLSQIKPYMARNGHIILTHNGMGTIEHAQDILAGQFWGYFCTMSAGASKTGNVISPNGSGMSTYQCFAKPDKLDTSSVLSEASFSKLFPNSRMHASIDKILWEKLAVNCVINPLTALNDIDNGELLTGDYENSIDNILKEVVDVATASGINLNPRDLKQSVIDVATNTATNCSSMRQDLLLGRKTEIEFINGFIVKKGQELGISAPTNLMLVEQVQAANFTSL